ncbi:hypothetical protein BJY04DRAFT_221932 [Aspergillus karnatakaensis]|uniref:zinc-dependent alcohol dehydrogenase family protein n=1 Tax=Aspergillus karnatakaensis TaxID=1810916 RepID=UPI003CCD3982
MSILPTTTKQWVITGFEGPSSLEYTEAPIPPLGDNDILVQIRGASLNPRDLLITQGKYPWPTKETLIPGSDGAGVILAAGPAVTRFAPGDKVITMLNQQHISGSVTVEDLKYSTGASVDGVFRQYGVFNEQALVRMPETLGFVEAATLSCAGVTAWNALFGGRSGVVREGAWVLTQGTGAVSLFALQLAKIFNAKVIATTSSDSKVPLLKALGADHVINYSETPAWGKEAKRLTGGVGVDLVVEVAGPTTLAQSAEALKLDGQITVVGFIGGQGSGEEVKVPSLLETWLNLYTARGVWVGSRKQLEELVSVVEEKGLKPVLDGKAFKLRELKEAFELLESGRNLGKIGIQID